MDNILTYVKYKADVPLKYAPFNEADAMVFAILIGMDFDEDLQDGMTMREMSDRYSNVPNPDSKDERYDEKEHLLYMVGNSVRYGNAVMSGFVKDIDDRQEKTFYAATFSFGKFFKLITFRGTDGSLLSWKENFVTLYKYPTPGQIEAKQYLEDTIKASKNPFVKFAVTGHSKGGNLACYSTIFAEPKCQKRIKQIYLFDAPGFIRDLNEEPGFFTIKDRMQAFVPEGCVIGKLMTEVGELLPVRCGGKGIYQHDMFWWKTLGTGLERAAATNAFSLRLSEKVNDWIESMPEEERKETVDELFDVFRKNGILHFADLSHMDIKKLLGIIMSATRLSSENRRLLGIIFKELWS